MRCIVVGAMLVALVACGAVCHASWTAGEETNHSGTPTLGQTPVCDCTYMGYADPIGYCALAYVILEDGKCWDPQHQGHSAVVWHGLEFHQPWNTDCEETDEPGDGSCSAYGPWYWMIQETSPGAGECWRTCNTMIAGEMDGPSCGYKDSGNSCEGWQTDASADEKVYDGDLAKVWCNVQAKVTGGACGNTGSAAARSTAYINWTSDVVTD